MCVEVLLPMTVSNTGFLLDRLGQDCHELQFLRELTQNAIEAIARSGKPGEIVWDVDWCAYERSEESVCKLSITDTGDGMTGPEMERFINQLSCSGSGQSLNGNYGVGAKIATAAQNPHGVVYLSWKEGIGSMIHLHRDAETEQYGLKQWELSDGTFSHHLPLNGKAKPDVIRKQGTKVVLLGRSEEDNTLQPEGRADCWISKYLNGRYFQFPEGVTVRAREGVGPAGKLRTLTGQKAYLEEHKLASGSVQLAQARAHWWILEDEAAMAKSADHIESSGHVAALYQDELYELTSGRTGIGRLQQFGIIFGGRQVVIYVEPLGEITTNTARTNLLLAGTPLPWSGWADEFRRKMPTKLRRFIMRKGAGALDTDHAHSIRKRLQQFLKQYRRTRYRRNSRGLKRADLEEKARRDRGKTGTGSHRYPGSRSPGDLYVEFEKKGGQRVSKTQGDPFPKVVWIGTEDGTRDPGILEARAASFLRDQNLLQINSDFHIFAEMVDHCCGLVGDVPGAGDVAITVVREWFEQVLVETVIGIQAMQGRQEWSSRAVDEALSPEALTASVMSLYLIERAARRQLGQKLGKVAVGHSD
jgi:hypothetical protein